MSRYYFHVIHRDAVRIHDEIGLELASDEVAVREGASAALEVTDEEGLSTDELESDGFRVVDDSGRVVAVLLFRTLRIEGTLHSFVAALTLLGLHVTGFIQQLPELLAPSAFLL